MTGKFDRLGDESLREIDYDQMRFDTDMLIGQYEPDYTVMDTLQRASYELGDKYMAINDPVWGRELIGDQPYDELLLRLARTPLFRRLQSIEQLTLGPQHATMPNSMYFSRWQHIWGSLAFVRKMTEGDERFDDRERMVLQLRTLLSDVGHTAFSHLGDWLFQGLQGGEDLHDRDLKDLLQVMGVKDMLDEYGFSIAETVFPETEDWVECASPDLCVDRVDYGFREILRWASPPIPLDLYRKELKNPQTVFEITEDNQLAFRSPALARYYAAGFSILPTEHWSHPVHRLQLQLFQIGVRASVNEVVEFDNMHPRDALYAIDRSFMPHFQTWDMLHLQRTMKDLALTQRQIFTQARHADLNHIFTDIMNDDWQFPAFPDPLQAYTWRTEEYGKPYSPQLDIQVVDSQAGDDQAFAATDRGLVAYLPPLKSRSVDPLIAQQDSGGPTYARLSEVDESYKHYVAGQRSMMLRAYEATVLMRRDIAERIVERNNRTNETWHKLLQRPRQKEALQRVVNDVESLAAPSALDRIREVDDQDILELTAALGRASLARRAENT